VDGGGAHFSDAPIIAWAPPPLVSIEFCVTNGQHRQWQARCRLGLLGHDVHKMVKSDLINPKLEFRNSKQIQNPNFQITKMRRS